MSRPAQVYWHQRAARSSPRVDSPRSWARASIRSAWRGSATTAAVGVGHIVVVEDHEGLRRAVERLLQARGHEAAAFPSAEALLASELRRGAACLILDVRLPGLSGFELRERLAQEGVKPPVIYVTAHDDGESRRRAEREGAFFFVKPVDGRELLDAVQLALGRS